MGINSLEIKNKTNYDFDNICYIDDFDVNSGIGAVYCS